MNEGSSHVIEIAENDKLPKRFPLVGVDDETAEQLAEFEHEAFNEQIMKDLEAYLLGTNAAVRSCFLLGRDLQAAFLRAKKKMAWKNWCRETFGFDVNEFYGQTEANLLVGNCSSVFPIRPGSMGRAIPGHDVEIVSPQGVAREYSLRCLSDRRSARRRNRTA